jgi:hypothetical protein
MSPTPPHFLLSFSLSSSCSFLPSLPIDTCSFFLRQSLVYRHSEREKDCGGESRRTSKFILCTGNTLCVNPDAYENNYYRCFSTQKTAQPGVERRIPPVLCVSNQHKPPWVIECHVSGVQSRRTRPNPPSQKLRDPAQRQRALYCIRNTHRQGARYCIARFAESVFEL